MIPKNYLSATPYIPGRGKKPELPTATFPVTNENFLTHDLFQLALEFHKWGFFWEAHEVLESLWHLQKDELKEFIQVLIQRSASQLKLKQGDPDASKRISESALERLKRIMDSKAFEGKTHVLGIDLTELRRGFQNESRMK